MFWKYRWPWMGSDTTTPTCLAGTSCGRHGLTEAIVTDPGQAILFDGWQSLGEELSLGQGWDTTFMLSGAFSWVGKQVLLSSNPVNLGEGQQLIAQATTKRCIEPRGPGHPHSIPPASTPFNFHNQDPYPWPASLPTAAEWWEVPRHGPHQCTKKEAGHHSEAEIGPGVNESYGQPHPITFALTRSWIWKWPKLSIDILISVIKVQKIWGFQVLMLWLTAPQGIQRPYEDQPASLQG